MSLKVGRCDAQVAARPFDGWAREILEQRCLKDVLAAHARGSSDVGCVLNRALNGTHMKEERG